MVIGAIRDIRIGTFRYPRYMSVEAFTLNKSLLIISGPKNLTVGALTGSCLDALEDTW